MEDQDSSERKPELQELLSRNRDRSRRTIFKVHPGRVHRIDPQTRKVDVELLIMNAYVDEENTRQVEPMGIVPSCPVATTPFYSEPISDGNLIWGTVATPRPPTYGIVLFCDRSLDKWLSGKGDVVDPELDHEHHPSDGIFIPGLWPFGAAPSLPQDSIVIGTPGAANDYPALNQKVLQELQNLKTAFSEHVHGPGSYAIGMTAVTGSSAPSASYSPPDSVGAQEVKVV